MVGRCGGMGGVGLAFHAFVASVPQHTPSSCELL